MGNARTVRGLADVFEEGHDLYNFCMRLKNLRLDELRIRSQSCQVLEAD